MLAEKNCVIMLFCLSLLYYISPFELYVFTVPFAVLHQKMFIFCFSVMPILNLSDLIIPGDATVAESATRPDTTIILLQPSPSTYSLVEGEAANPGSITVHMTRANTRVTPNPSTENVVTSIEQEKVDELLEAADDSFIEQSNVEESPKVQATPAVDMSVTHSDPTDVVNEFVIRSHDSPDVFIDEDTDLFIQ